MAKGGDINEITFAHPTVGTGVFLPKGSESNTLDLGGFRNTDDASMIAGGGELIQTKNRVAGSFECVIANDADTRQDLQQATALAASSVDADWTVEDIHGRVYQGTGYIVGDIQEDKNASTFTIKVMVPEWKQQS